METTHLNRERTTTEAFTVTGTVTVTVAENRIHGRTNIVNREGGEIRTMQPYIQSRKNKHDSIVHMNINAQSLNNKKDELKLIVEKYKPLIIGVTESWADNGKMDGEYKLKKYIMYRDDRVAGRGGGTMLYISTDLGHRECLALKRPTNQIPFDSSIWCWVTPSKGKKILVGCIYRSTSSLGINNDKLMELLKLANDIAGENRLLILGDFNVPNIDWINKVTLPRARKVDRDFLETVSDNFLWQHVKKYTRFRGGERSVLDLTFTKEEEDVKNIEVILPLGRSDHGIVIGELICKWRSKVVPKKTPVYFRGRYDAIIEEIRNINWGEQYSNKTIIETLEHYNSKYKKMIEENVPLSSPREYNEPWMNKRIMKLWKKKKCAWERIVERSSNGRWRVYKKYRDMLRKEIRKSRRLFEKKIAGNARHNKRGFFKYVNSRLTVRPEIMAMKTGDNKIVEEDKEIAETMVSYFSTVHTSYNGEEMPAMLPLTENKIEDIIITADVVEKKLKNLDANKSCGPDGIHPYVLNKTAKEMSVPLAIIFQKSLDEGVCPDEWKCANVTPIHKKGDRTEPSNYRPVSLTSQICKVLESIIRDRIMDHLTRNNLLNDAQHGFREGRSCLTNLLETLEQWTEILDEGDCIDVAYLDFRKAFDLVSHEHLIYKLSKYGIKGKILNWIKDFLSNRKQRVVIRGTTSSWEDVTSGVPQGSVLGPILFLIFINDLPTELLSKLSLFADDSKLFSRIITNKGVTNPGVIEGNRLLQEDLNKVVEWAGKWKMEFNVDKCKVMHLGHNNPRGTYSMGDRQLEATEGEKDLGVFIDNKLDFGKHIRAVVGKANSILGMIRVSFACMNKTMFLNLYPALVRPLLEYCVQVWSPYKKNTLDCWREFRGELPNWYHKLRN